MSIRIPHRINTNRDTPKRFVLDCCQVKLWEGDICRCREIKMIQKNIFSWITKINGLQSISYRSDRITYSCINVFMSDNNNRTKNDYNNKKRENIIGCIINNKIPIEYYRFSRRWTNLKKSVDEFIKKLCDTKEVTSIEDIHCIHKAGRGHHYDFKLIVNNKEEFILEFKFNASSINDTPQIVSPIKPSQYLECSYEEYYYDNYFTTFVKEHKLPLPTKTEYLKTIHHPTPECLKIHQERYYRGCVNSSKYSANEEDIKFYKSSKKLSHNSISNFITKYNVYQDKLTEYLLETQKNKYYMLYKENHIYLERINLDDYIISEVVKEPHKNRYIAKTKTGKKLKILLRWKNGNGIAFPSFQIS